MTSSAIRTLLKAACAATGLDEKDLAARAGVPKQRGYDIINERCIATDQEVVALLTATGIDPDRVADLIRDADGGVTAIELAVRIRACVGRDVDVEAAIRAATLKIDYISVVADFEVFEQHATRLRKLGLVEVPSAKRSASLDKLYKRHLYVKGLGIGLQYEPRTRAKKRKEDAAASGNRQGRKRAPSAKPARYARVELKGAKSRAVQLAKELLALLDLETHDVTRIDLTIDVAVPFNALHLLPTDDWKESIVYGYRGKPWQPPNDRQPHERTYLGAGGAESVYEYKRGGVLVRVYDWNRRHDRKKKNPPRTRIEVQLRFRAKKIGQLQALENPFASLYIVGAHAPGQRRADYVDGLVLRECGFYKPHLVLPRLSKRQRTRVEALLKHGAPLPQPRNVFEASWAATLARYFRRLGLS